MKINTISAVNYAYNNKKAQSFNGTWQKRLVFNGADYHTHNQKDYIPDENESPRDIAKAWQKETGLLPIDWVKKVNPFNQVNHYKTYGEEKDTEYRINGQKYIPLDVLKESVKLKIEYDNAYKTPEIRNYVDLAELAMITNNKKEAKIYEKEMVKIFENERAPKLQYANSKTMDEYKNHWGTEVRARAIYPTGKDIYEDSDEMVKEYKNRD